MSTDAIAQSARRAQASSGSVRAVLFEARRPNSASVDPIFPGANGVIRDIRGHRALILSAHCVSRRGRGDPCYSAGMLGVRTLAGIGLVALAAACGGTSPQPAQQAPAAARPATPSAQPPAVPPPIAQAPAPASVPPIPFEGAARPPEIIRAVYTFAADHPEVLSKVPCFCGCQRMGHRDNDDCFVGARNQAGQVTVWEPHGAT